jgi:monofunctional biosynthetic peptidoglycan transglycosylase
VLAAHWLLLVIVVSTTIAWTFARPPSTPLMAYRMAFQGHVLEPLLYVPLDRIPPTVRTMLVRLEDWTFYQHHGIDITAIKNAIRVNKAIGRTVYGGSTITQQLARSLYLTTHRNYARKYIEAIVALTLDAFLSKDRILELYFNYVEWGPGVFGIGAAARHHFGKDIRALTLDEYRRLLTILSSPVRYGVWSFGSNRLLAERYDYLVGRFPSLR